MILNEVIDCLSNKKICGMILNEVIECPSNKIGFSDLDSGNGFSTDQYLFN